MLIQLFQTNMEKKEQAENEMGSLKSRILKKKVYTIAIFI